MSCSNTCQDRNSRLKLALSFSAADLPMDNASKSRNGNAAVALVRGVILSPHGWQRFQVAKQEAEAEETEAKHFTQEYLRDRTTLSLNTLSRIFKRQQGVDRQSLEYLFQAFGLELKTADFTSPTALSKESESLRANPQQDWDNAADTSVFYGRETELAQLWGLMVDDRCRVVTVLGIGGIGKSTIAVKAALQMQAEFEIVVWRSLSNSRYSCIVRNICYNLLIQSALSFRL